MRTFRGGECSAEDLLSTLWSLFDRRLDALENVVFELADLLDLPDKSQTLLTAWENFHVAVSRTCHCRHGAQLTVSTSITGLFPCTRRRFRPLYHGHARC